MAITYTDQPSAPAVMLDGPKAHTANRVWMDRQAPVRSVRRYRVISGFLHLVVRLYSRLLVEGLERLPDGPSILCFTHESWADPFYLIAAVPGRPRVYFFGPEQEEMTRGFRNRLMRWAGVVIPFRPGSRGLVAATARAQSLLSGGAIVAIAGEGRIHAGEGVVLPLRDGPAYLAVRAGVPIVPVSINGTAWLGFRRVVRVRVGLPIDVKSSAGRSRAEAVQRLTVQTRTALEALVSDFPEQPKPGPIGRWLTELFNDWPEGSRPTDGSKSGGRQVE